MPPTDETARDRATELALQQAQIDVLSAKLNKAERAVAQARTPVAAADAHRRADALLLELEAAEDTFQILKQTTPRSPAKPPPGGLAPPFEQGHLFSAGGGDRERHHRLTQPSRETPGLQETGAKAVTF